MLTASHLSHRVLDAVPPVHSKLSKPLPSNLSITPTSKNTYIQDSVKLLTELKININVHFFQKVWCNLKVNFIHISLYDFCLHALGIIHQRNILIGFWNIKARAIIIAMVLQYSDEPRFMHDHRWQTSCYSTNFVTC